MVATAEKDHDFFEISTGSRFVVVVATLVFRSTKDRGRKAWSCQNGWKVFYIGKPLKQKQVEATALDSTPGSPKDESIGEKARNNGEKRQGGTPVKDRPTKRAAVMSKPPHGLKARVNPGAGNCVLGGTTSWSPKS